MRNSLATPQSLKEVSSKIGSRLHIHNQTARTDHRVQSSFALGGSVSMIFGVYQPQISVAACYPILDPSAAMESSGQVLGSYRLGSVHSLGLRGAVASPTSPETAKSSSPGENPIGYACMSYRDPRMIEISNYLARPV